ncbi:mitochondrial pyruvate carrier 4 isoform X3 [Physcomitrium patens]|uniref:mitochondrial pyruvate carrier 4 isoform X3 n=1 Tax=Physcomitrium patens TaxID=3218 RepID=UPI003CCD1C10
MSCLCFCSWFAVHFWAPTFKWGISIANVSDFSMPPEAISYPQQIAVAASGLIWSRYSMVIVPEFISSLARFNKITWMSQVRQERRSLSHDQAAMKDCVVSRAPVNSAIGWEPTGLMKCWHCIACNLQRS